MPLSAGSKLGPYEIQAPLGAGGMGEVYRAKDTRLDRAVAIKVLPETRTASPEIRQRFEREAKTISQLSHPNICALYDVGHQDGVDYLVLELLEGQTLADRLAKGPLPLDQGLRYGGEIAAALDKAHRHGIVHRDLKPGNVMLTASGLKVLDFGLAKAFGPGVSKEAVTALPTETPLTEAGTLLGTVQYMAPEQLEGKEADARTDIFALGVVLFEMTTGRHAFTGASRASLIGSILRDEPAPVSRLQPIAPRSLDRVVSTCLAKEPEDRWQTARDVSLQLDGIRQERSAAEPFTAIPPPRRRAALLPWAVAAAALAIAAAAILSAPRRAAPVRPIQSFLVPPPKTTFHVYGANVSGVKVSPDGRRIAFGTREADGNTRLWIRDLESLEPFPVPGGESPLFPFWSPDSRSIGFFARGKLKVVEASPSAAPPREIADVAEPRGGSWGEDGTILYTGANFAPLMRVPASGGKPVQATKLDRAVGEAAHRWPFFLPGAKTFLFEVRRFTPAGTPIAGLHGIYAGSLSGEKRLLLSEDTGAEYVAPGYLLFRRANNLMAVRFDASSLTLRGEPVVLAHDIEGFVGTGASIFSVSGDLLVYSPRVGATPSKIAWFDRSGRELATVGAAGQFVYLAMAADGGSVVTSRIEDPLPPDLWLFDTGVGRGIRLTRDAVAQVAPIFSADPNRILFSAFSTGPWDLWEMSPRPGQVSKPFLQSEATKIANDVSPDGRWLLFRQFNPGTRGDLMVVSLEGDRTPRPYLASLDDETNGVFSRDGRWVAYASDESGRKEIYVASFPDPTRRSRVSADGGAQPRWSRDGKELYYVRAGQLLSVAVSRKENEIAFGESRPLFPLPLLAMNDPGFDQFTRYDVSPDGRFLALVRAGEEAPTPLVMVSHWRGLLPDSGRP